MERVRFAVTPGAPMEVDDQFFDDLRPAPEVVAFTAMTRHLLAHAAAQREYDAWWDDYQSGFPVFREQWTADQIRGWATNEAEHELDAFLSDKPFVRCPIENVAVEQLALWSLYAKPWATDPPDVFDRIYSETV